MAKGYIFYDKVAKKFGRYQTPHKNTVEYPHGNPEEAFRTKLLECSGKDKTALDLGCADGRFTLSIAPHFKKIVAIDLSKRMLSVARKSQKEKRITNVSFEEQDANHTPYSNETFDIVYSRRGPTPYKEIKRLLKLNGFLVEISIGEMDAKEIKLVFGRGQLYGRDQLYGKDGMEKVKGNSVKNLEKLGFKVLFAEDYFYTEYYPTYKDLDLFLQGVPIFEDFDSEKDKERLLEYVRKNSTEKGIRLPRHRVVILAQKKR